MMPMGAAGNPRSELNEITERIIGCAFAVSNTLGSGFVEKVYEHALAHELRQAGLAVEQQSTQLWQTQSPNQTHRAQLLTITIHPRPSAFKKREIKCQTFNSTPTTATTT
jgi:hypothetical protein